MSVEQLREQLLEVMDEQLYSGVVVARLIGISRPTFISFMKGRRRPSTVTMSKVKKFLRNQKPVLDLMNSLREEV